MLHSPDHREPLDDWTRCVDGCKYRTERPTGRGGIRVFCLLHGDKLRRDDAACVHYAALGAA